MLHQRPLNGTRRERRDVHQFTSDCNSDLTFWSAGQRIASSFPAPGVASAQALAKLNTLGCWLSKFSDATSSALAGLLTDVDSVR